MNVQGQCLRLTGKTDQRNGTGERCRLRCLLLFVTDSGTSISVGENWGPGETKGRVGGSVGVSVDRCGRW